MPCHPILTRHLLTHLQMFGTARDGRLFRGERGVLMDTYAKCIHGHDEINRKRMGDAFSDGLTSGQSLDEQAAQNLARALADYDARLALQAVREATRRLLAETKAPEASLPDNLRATLRQAEDVLGDR